MRAIRFRCVVLFLISVFLPAGVCFALEFSLDRYGSMVDLPDGWVIMDDSDPDFPSFSDSAMEAVFQVQRYPGNTFSSAREMFQQIQTELNGRGEGVDFDFLGNDAVFADISFPTSSFDARGYWVCINGEEDRILLAFTGEALFQEKSDVLLSALDSYVHYGRFDQPGPVSYFDYPVSDRKGGEPVTSGIGDKKITWNMDPEELESLQYQIEREARVLITYENDRDGAWKRYYRQVYRNSFARMKPLYTAIERFVEAEGIPREEIPRLLLSWVQQFTYERTGTLSDMVSPLACAALAAGDCDARGLLYVILLHYFDIDAILLVSSVYSHSVAGVDMEGKGARFILGETSYLVAETTEQVALGLIAKDMADPAGWIPVEFTRF